MRKLNILRCGDQLYWAYHWIAQEQARYSRHNIRYAKWDEVDAKKGHLDGVDIIYIHGPDISTYHATQLTLEAKSRGIKVIGGYGGNPEYWSAAEPRTYAHADMIVAISPQTYAFCKFHYTNIPVIFMPESIDTHFFTPGTGASVDRFVVGWAGGIHKKIKRAHLLQQLNFPVFTRCQWKEQRYAQEPVTLEHMVEFYRSIDVLVVTSLSECQPRVVMEAMACGLPVVATDVGSMRMLLDQRCIVPVEPDYDVVAAMNERLATLHSNTSWRVDTGRRNRVHAELCWSWSMNSDIWDLIFSAVADDHIAAAQLLSTSWLDSRELAGEFNKAAQEYYNIKYQK